MSSGLCRSRFFTLLSDAKSASYLDALIICRIEVIVAGKIEGCSHTGYAWG